MAFQLHNPPYETDNTPIFEVDLEEGVVGKANLNGSILVQKGLDPLKQEEVIAHESVHVQDIKDGLLSYDDDNVYFRNNTKQPFKMFSRADMLEGAKNLPWEKRAWKANAQFKKNKNA